MHTRPEQAQHLGMMLGDLYTSPYLNYKPDIGLVRRKLGEAPEPSENTSLRDEMLAL
jgi:hypothetical protein